MSIYNFDPNTLKAPLTFIYNGANQRWKDEAAFIKAKDTGNKLSYIDASKADPGPGIDPAAVKKTPFLRDATGKLVSGLDAVYGAHNGIGFGFWFRFNRIPGFVSEGTGVKPEKKAA
ncbi:MAG TPA: hypothetical protein VNZ68_07265 [Rhodocyclaceae bacterium]|nr:hypothetical protein [Rhodocyclaceae bacterium]